MRLDLNKLPADDFAIPEQRAYPIPDRLHARLALEDVKRAPRVKDRARVRLAVAGRFPELMHEVSMDHMREVAADKRG